MTTQKAVSILSKQIVKIEQKDFHYPIWNIQTTTYLREFFGEKSEQYYFFQNHYWNIDTIHAKGITIEVKKYIAISFLNDCIDTINDIGLYQKENKGNYISRLSDRMITFWIVSVFSGGVYFGRIIYKVFECAQ